MPRLITQTPDDFLLSLLDENEQTDKPPQNHTLSLADYLQTVQLVIHETLHSAWVKAEIRSVSSKSGHFYFELADKDTDGKINASCRGNLWRSNANKVIRRFEQTTGITPDKGLTLLFKINANFHPQYGFSVTILDIDPSFTLGEMAQKYQQMLQKLADNDLLTKNQSLTTPFDIQNVLVIAPENAAGLGDFRADADRLQRTKACQFFYQHATFQGNHAPDSIQKAINTGLEHLHAQQILPDILVIIRGGGSVGDLAYLNDYQLSAFLAKLPLPVWVGIGHERDRVLLDEVAHTSFDTPSKVIANIYKHLSSITQAAKNAFLQIGTISQQQILQHKQQINAPLLQINQLAKQQLALAKQQTNQQLQNIKYLSFQQIQQAKQQSEQLRALILLQNPKNILNQGYSIIRNEQQQIITSVNQIQPKQALNIELKDGIVPVTVG
ncbi:exodeoxyribonuclease VII large subunit [Moraxella macacae 0408225]|uniref:Exodeoxyribonuclease 7 large subunit n=1 Tax=Moraxella macacae 0408225 TaxID=1230338 RepID=L2F736_9GAMM|nr:exodeoxyribonuclease VII large subunit [Moraxella macacae]ELA08561.1 exodeoxyribonuclease VII large subunit [Moraxella macacae 0408225]